MTVIQGMTPTTPTKSNVGQPSSTDGPSADTFEVSMLMALLMPTGTPTVSQQANQTTSVPDTALTLPAPDADLTPQDESTVEQPGLARDAKSGGSREANCAQTPPKVTVGRFVPVPASTAEVGTKGRTGHQPTHVESQSVLNQAERTGVPTTTQTQQQPVQPAITNTTRMPRPATPATQPVDPSATSPTARTPGPAPAGTASTESPVVLPEANSAALTESVRSAPVPAGRTPTPDVTVSIQDAGVRTNEPLPQVTIESAEISSGGNEAKPTSVPSQTEAPKVPDQSSSLLTETSQPRANPESTNPSRGTTPQSSVVAAENQSRAPVSRTPVEGQPTPVLDGGGVDDVNRGLVQNPARTQQTDELLPSPQREEPQRVRATRLGVQRSREQMAGRNSAATGTARGHTVDEATQIDQADRRSSDGDSGIENERETQPRMRAASMRPSMVGVTSTMAGARATGGAEKLTGQRPMNGQVDQSMLNTPLEEPGFQAKPEDRVTLRFTDDDGVEGRLRVAVRGQSVRATIVAGDPNAAERIGSGVSEIQRALNKQGFQEAQITVQQARGADDPGGQTIASAVRAAPETVSGSPTSRALDDQAHRERQNNGPRDQQNQHQNNNRSQHRSRERQER